MDAIFATSTDADNGELSISDIRNFIDMIMNVYRMVIDALKSVIKPLLGELIKGIGGAVAGTETDA